jgi:hypothetical protein
MSLLKKLESRVPWKAGKASHDTDFDAGTLSCLSDDRWLPMKRIKVLKHEDRKL